MQQKYLEQTNQELRVRNYSSKTIKSYSGCLKEYFNFAKTNLVEVSTLIFSWFPSHSSLLNLFNENKS